MKNLEPYPRSARPHHIENGCTNCIGAALQRKSLAGTSPALAWQATKCVCLRANTKLDKDCAGCKPKSLQPHAREEMFQKQPCSLRASASLPSRRRPRTAQVIGSRTYRRQQRCAAARCQHGSLSVPGAVPRPLPSLACKRWTKKLAGSKRGEADTGNGGKKLEKEPDRTEARNTVCKKAGL